MEKLVLMSGLPRSGSTLLSALLYQNPRLHTEPSSPILQFMEAVENTAKENEAYSAYPKPDCLTRTLQGIAQTYYFTNERPVVIDKNRAWSEKIPEIERYLMPKAKIIYPVRDLTEITASLLKVAHRSPYDPKEGRHNFIDQSLVKLDMTINDENRCRMVLSDHGVLGQCLLSISKAFKNGYRDRFLFVEYNELMKSPQAQLDRIYDFIDEPHYKHNFDNIVYKQRERDQEVFKVSDLHQVHPSLTPSNTDPKAILPSQVYKDLQGKEMWRG